MKVVRLDDCINEIKSLDNNGCITRSTNHICEDIRNEVKEFDAIQIPEGATNGDMIKMLFPGVEVDEKSEDTVHLKDKWHNPLVFIQIPKDIWNLPYKKEVEE
jgi:hypothetical protein